MNGNIQVVETVIDRWKHILFEQDLSEGKNDCSSCRVYRSLAQQELQFLKELIVELKKDDDLINFLASKL